MRRYDTAVLNGTAVIPYVGTVRCDVGIRDGRIAALADSTRRTTRAPSWTPATSWCCRGAVPRPSRVALTHPTAGGVAGKVNPPTGFGGTALLYPYLLFGRTPPARPRVDPGRGAGECQSRAGLRTLPAHGCHRRRQGRRLGSAPSEPRADRDTRGPVLGPGLHSVRRDAGARLADPYAAERPDGVSGWSRAGQAPGATSSARSVCTVRRCECQLLIRRAREDPSGEGITPWSWRLAGAGRPCGTRWSPT